jgi:hypothetical protein
MSSFYFKMIERGIQAGFHGRWSVTYGAFGGGDIG